MNHAPDIQRPRPGSRNAAVALVNAIENLEYAVGFTNQVRFADYNHWMSRVTEVDTHDALLDLMDELTQVIQERMVLLRNGF